MTDEVLTVKDAVYKLQLSLLKGIKDENLLFAAGSLMSQSDYQDVLEGAHISTEEYEIMKDLIIPLGRVPQFSTQSEG